jgi:hypothetical protein
MRLRILLDPRVGRSALTKMICGGRKLTGAQVTIVMDF